MSCWDGLVKAGLVRREVTLSSHTTYKLGGPADLYAEVDEAETLSRLGECLAREPIPTLVLGRGSNLLVADNGFRGLVIRLGQSFSSFEVKSDGVVEAGGSVSLPRMARAAGAAGRGGLEWCVGVPGSVGGAVRQNAGCFGSDTAEVLIDATIVSLDTGLQSVRSADELEFSYRHSNVGPKDVVVAARFATTEVDPLLAGEEMRRITRWRKDHQPGGTLNAGSVFKNPEGGFAGEIIDRLGLKGFEINGVRVSPRHANFIEADAGSSASDVRALIEAVRAKVEAATGIGLETEIQFVGFDGEH